MKTIYIKYVIQYFLIPLLFFIYIIKGIKMAVYEVITDIENHHKTYFR